LWNNKKYFDTVDARYKHEEQVWMLTAIKTLSEKYVLDRVVT
jgi:hypothetical protein